jgi:hypothetical protein
MVNCMRISLKIGIWDKFQSHSNVNFPHPMRNLFSCWCSGYRKLFSHSFDFHFHLILL